MKCLTSNLHSLFLPCVPKAEFTSNVWNITHPTSCITSLAVNIRKYTTCSVPQAPCYHQEDND